ncbi:hypothetical protein GCK72_017407 [Caenorhabditis remanei]|uniref:Uncharacterized protein n=1 Tax=Caenorhabditis remanei TaxID=31234 RepID=A0A6A5G7N9_CAERE|nr:hypothetical protein GCK72_017407 [Caenorhabditis remanei]KAF1750856.1 hypothetical protein GCK72_017407 [Caenorhabditis remanei]
MTTDLRVRSKSFSNIFASKGSDDDEEDLIPREKDDDTKTSRFEKWKSSLNLNFRTSEPQQADRRTSRGNSIFGRPPKLWDNRRASLTNLKTQIKEKITGRSNENLATTRDSRTRMSKLTNDEPLYDDRMPPPFYIVDRGAWTFPYQ